jgi:hypothetical protein
MTPVELKTEQLRQQSLDKSPLRKNFRKMYGKDAKFIDVQNIVDLARTINGFFLTRNDNNRA